MMMVEIGAQAWVLHAFVPLGPSWNLVLTTGPPFCPYSILRLFKELNLQVAEVSPFLILWWLVLVIRYLQKLQNPLGYLSLISCTIRAPLSYGVCFITLKECSVSCNETPTGPDQAPVCRAALKCFCALKCTKKKSALALLLQSVYRVSLSLSLLLFSYYYNFISLCLSLTLFSGLVSLRLHSFSTASATAASCVYEGSLLLVAGTLLLLTAQQQLPWQLTCCSIWHFLYLFLASLSLSLLAFSATFSALLSH